MSRIEKTTDRVGGKIGMVPPRGFEPLPSP
jgi:hypothetical protein